MKILIFSLIILCFSIEIYPDEAIAWSQEKIDSSGIEREKVTSGFIMSSIELPGEIHFDPNSLIYILPKIDGIVTSIFKNVGDYIDKGTPLAILESQEMAQAQCHYLAVLKKWELKKNILAKEQNVRNISAERDYLNAQLEADASEIELDLAIQNLQILGLSLEEIVEISKKGKDLRFYVVKSPAKGRIIEREITLGAFVKSSKKIFTIADFDRVWVEIAVNQEELPYIKENDQVEIISSEGRKGVGVLSHFQPIIQENTRRALVFAVLKNDSEYWKIGQYVTAKVLKEKHEASLVVPQCALQNVHGQNVVFVEKDNTFTARKVTIGKRDDKNVEILSGLNEGDVIVSNNCFLIKADMEKEEGEHH